MMNPFTVGVAQGIAEVAPMSGMGFRFLCHICMISVASVFIMRYALKVQADSSKSVVYGDDIKGGMSEEELLNSSFGIREKLVPGVMAVGVVVVIYGCKEFGWYFGELSAVFMIMGIISAIVMSWGPNTIAKKFEGGFIDAASVCMMIGLARGILMVLQAGNIIDTVVYYASLPLSAFPTWLCGVAMLLIQTLINFPTPSGSGQAATMPIMASLVDLLGITRDTTVLAFQFGDGLSNILLPTSSTAIICGMAGVKIDKWWKFCVPCFLALFVTQATLMDVAVMTGFGA